MQRKRQLRIIALTFALAIASAGCPKDPYRASIQGSDDVAQAISKAIPVISQFYTEGKATDEEKATAGQYLIIVTKGNQTFRQGANNLHASGIKGRAAYVALAQAFVNSVPTDPRAFRYKSADAQAKFNEVLGGVKDALDGILLVIESTQKVGA